MDSLILSNIVFVKRFVATRLNSEGEQQEFNGITAIPAGQNIILYLV